jgi:hypothetical protein
MMSRSGSTIFWSKPPARRIKETPEPPGPPGLVSKGEMEKLFGVLLRPGLSVSAMWTFGLFFETVNGRRYYFLY